jgi:hypothetical protein
MSVDKGAACFRCCLCENHCAEQAPLLLLLHVIQIPHRLQNEGGKKAKFYLLYLLCPLLFCTDPLPTQVLWASFLPWGC